LKKKLLITKQVEVDSPLRIFCTENNIELFDLSFIRFELEKFKLSTDFEVIFFGSKRSFDFFTKQFQIDKNIQLACIGEATKKHIELHGFNVSFYGEKSGNPQQVAFDFGNWLGKRKAIIPSSNISKESIIRTLKNPNIKSLVVYKTLPVNKKIDFNPDTIVFTSPSNVVAFLLENKIDLKTKIIAWGKTTSNFLKENNQKVDLVLDISSDEALIKVI
jgi:uroporphyrinogen-III synthase